MTPRRIASLLLATLISAVPAATLAVAGTSAPVDVAEAARTPAERFTATVDALKHEDFGELLRAIDLRNSLDGARERWRKERDYTLADYDEPAEGGTAPAIATAWLQLQTDDGIDALVTRWQPVLAARAQEQTELVNRWIANKLRELVDADDATPAELAQQRDLLMAFQGWAHRIDFGDPQRLRRALVAIATEVRASGLATLDEVKLLEFDDALRHGDRALRALKRVLSVYDIDAGAILDSARAREEPLPDGQLRVHYAATLFGVPMAWAEDYTLMIGVWLPTASAQWSDLDLDPPPVDADAIEDARPPARDADDEAKATEADDTATAKSEPRN